MKQRDLPPEDKVSPVHHLIFCEHAPVYTLGKSGSESHLLIGQNEMQNSEIEFFKINRGGDITYHGPGQITGYPIFDLDEFFTDVHRYVRTLEEAIIRTIGEYGVIGDRLEKHTGVWIFPNEKSDKYRKICAIGVHLSRWVTMHGFAFNVNTDLRYFDYIIPCGIDEEDKSVTSLAAEVGYEINMEDVSQKLKGHLAELFSFEFTTT